MTHDATNGNSYTFDAENRIAQVNGSAVTYNYDTEGKRVRKDVNGQPSTEYIYFDAEIIAERNVTTGAWSNYIGAS